MQDEEDPTKMQRLGNKQLLIQNVDYAIDMFLIYVLTLSIFPGFLSEDTGSHSLGSWYVLEHNYMIIFCALVVKNALYLVIYQVCTGFDCNVQCVGSDREIRSFL